MANNQEHKLIVESLQKKLLDFSKRNNLINYKFSQNRSRPNLRIIDEIPDVIYKKIIQNKSLSFAGIPLPGVKPPVDENTKEFKQALKQAKENSPEYLQGMEKLKDQPNSKLSTQLENELKDKVRQTLGLPPVVRVTAFKVDEEVKKYKIDPSYTLSLDPSDKTNHKDNSLQTLMFEPDLISQLGRIYNRSKFYEQELGINPLYLVFGFLEWYEAESSQESLISPLIVMPVQIKQIKRDEYVDYEIEFFEEEPSINLSLKEKLRQDFGIELPDLNDFFEMPNLKPLVKYLGGEKYSVSFIHPNTKSLILEKIVVASSLEEAENLAQDFNELPELKALNELKEKSEPIKKYLLQVESLIKGQNSWQVLREMNLSILSFQKISLFNDLKEYQDKTPQELVLSLMNSKDDLGQGFEEEYDLESDSMISKIPPLVSDADSSQVSSIIDVLDGKNMVIEGPPGTGKSQTITNMIAALLNQGKKVLFVAEKNAALKVVKNRLDKVGIGNFCLELHSNKARKTQVVESLNLALRAKKQNYAWRNELAAIAQRENEIKLEIKNYLEFILQDSRVKEHQNVRDIIGQYLILKDKHQDLLTQTIPFLNYRQLALLGKNDKTEAIKSIVSLSQPLKLKAYTNHPLYKTSQVKGLNVESAKESVIKASKNLEQLTKQLSDFSELSFGVHNSLQDLKKALQSYTQIPLEPGLDVIQFEKSLKDETLKELKEAINSLQELKTLLLKFKQSQLGLQLPELLNSSFNQDISSLVESMRKIQWSGSIDQLESKTLDIKNGLETYGLIKDDFHTLVNFFNYSGALITEDFELFLTLIQKIKKITVEHLKHNYAYVHDLDSQEKVMAAFTKISQIEQWQKELDETIIWDQMDLTEVQIRECFEVFNEGGIFLRFSPSYFKIKSLVQNFSVSKKINFAKVKSIILDLNKIRKEKKSILDLKIYADLTAPTVKQIKQQADIINLIRGLKDHVGKKNYRKTVVGLQKITESQLTIFHKFWEQLDELQSFNGLLTSGRIFSDELVELINKRNLGKKAIEYTQEKKINTDLTFAQLVDLQSQSQRFVELYIKTYQSSVVQEFNLSEDVDSVELNKLIQIVQYRDLIESLAISAEFKEILFRSNFISLRLNHLKLMAEKSLSQLNELELLGLRIPYLPISYSNSPLSNLNDLENYLRYEQDLSVLVSLNNHPLIKDLDLGQVPQLVSSLIEFETTSAQISEIHKLWTMYSVIKNLSLDKDVDDLTGQQLDQVRAEYQILDDQKMILNSQMIKANLAARPIPKSTTKSNRVADKMGTELINHLIVKPNARVSLRDLLIKSGQELSEILPCFMMSPLSVAQFLPQNSLHFDVLIIDEASQVRLEDILSSVIRCDQIVVVGDNKQLPPTNFFQTDDNDDDELDINYESILDMTEKAFPYKRRLKWHYRSKDENLIKFSNASFYDGDLILFPSTLQNRGLGLIPRRVDGIYENNKNMQEAVEIVKEAIAFIKKNLDQSLGLAAINKAQAELIEDLFYEQTQSDPVIQEYLAKWEEQLEPFFIKNLENVQGDERDAIYISLVYGKDINGNFFNRFGPINSDKGHRRLNVLFSRAKRVMKVFYSIPADGIQVNDLATKEGVRCLKNFITFLDSNGAILPVSKQNSDTSVSPKISEFENFVAEKLEKQGLKLKRQVGESGYFIDMAVQDPTNGGYVLGIECDGATYHSSKFMRDRDKTRQKVLESLGWKIVRIWSSDWFRDSDKEIARILKILNP